MERYRLWGETHRTGVQCGALGAVDSERPHLSLAVPSVTHFSSLLLPHRRALDHVFFNHLP